MLFGFSKADFISWLQGYQPDEFVGSANHCNLCPIATFLALRMECNVEVWGDVATLTFNDGTLVTDDMPEWAVVFVGRVDEGCFLSQPPIAACIALDIMEEIQAQEAA